MAQCVLIPAVKTQLFFVFSQFVSAPMRIVLKLKERMMDLVSESVCTHVGVKERGREREKELRMEQAPLLGLFIVLAISH